jgi:hypothetical protein
MASSGRRFAEHRGGPESIAADESARIDDDVESARAGALEEPLDLGSDAPLARLVSAADEQRREAESEYRTRRALEYEADQRGRTTRSSSAALGAGDKAVSRTLTRIESTAVNGGLLQAHAEAIAEQDKSLDMLSASVARIGAIGLAIASELDDQSRLIEDTAGQVESANTAVREGERAVKTLIAKSGGPRWCGVLCAMIAVLAALVWIALS